MKIRIPVLCALAGAALISSCDMNTTKNIRILPYPAAERGDVVDDYFGTPVPDPYRWLEDEDSEATRQWIAAENAVTEDYLAQIPYRSAIRERLAELWNYPKEGAPFRKGAWYYFFRNDGLQNQSVLYRAKEPGGEAELFFDPNALSDDGTVALASYSFSDDGRWFAYGTAASGSDWQQIHVRSTVDGRDTDDLIEWVKNAGAVWSPDSEGFYYSAYDAPAQGVYSAQNRFQKIRYHRLGTPQSADATIYEDSAHPLRYFTAWPSDDGRWLFILSSEGTSGSELLFRRTGEERFRTLFPGFDHDFAPVECRDDRLWYTTNRNAPNGELRCVDLNAPERDSAVIPERDSALLEGVASSGGYLFASYLKDAQSEIGQYRFDGSRVREVELPAMGTVGGFNGEKEDGFFYYTLTNYTQPATVYRYDIASGRSTLHHAPELKFDPTEFVTEQVFYPSKDGTLVPMFVSHRRDIRLNGQNPCYLYGYGGFQISLTPGFSSAAILFMEQGGIYCVANLRGGSEYGEAWHRAGMLENKQNVFDDFIAAAEWLIARGYTSSSKLAIAGGSNGGLLVGACETQRPDLFAVCLPAVGVMDMLRYHLFTIGWGWAVEYGTSADEEQFRTLLRYSPLHNIRPGTAYPATLVTMADHDDRVVPAHSFKFAAEMQHCQNGEAPVLIRIGTKAGHGAGKPTSMQIAETADTYAFLFWNTDTPYRPIK